MINDLIASENNTYSAEKIRFAYVIFRPLYTDTAENSQLDWQFDAKGSMQKMTDTEYVVNVYEDQIKVKTLIGNPIVKVNLIV